MARRWMGCVPFTEQADKYGLMTTCRIVADAPVTKEPSRKTRNPAWKRTLPIVIIALGTWTVIQDEQNERNRPAAITNRPRSRVPL